LSIVLSTNSLIRSSLGPELHAPDPPVQYSVTTHTTDPHALPTPMYVLPAPHAVPPTAHTAVELLQQAPVGHTVVPHAVCSPMYVLPAGHELPPVVHTLEVLLQHAPVGHGLDAHVVPSPWYAPAWVAQSPALNVAHDRSSRQHAPFVHGFGVHVVPGSPHVPAPQSACVATVHAVPLQQLAASEPTVAPAGVGTPVITNEAPLPGRHSPTAIEPPLPGATSLVNRKLNMFPHRITCALWSLPVPCTNVPTLYCCESIVYTGSDPLCAGPAHDTLVEPAPVPLTAQSLSCGFKGSGYASGSPTDSTPWNPTPVSAPCVPGSGITTDPAHRCEFMLYSAYSYWYGPVPVTRLPRMNRPSPGTSNVVSVTPESTDFHA
jgi:hypothetical protein